MSCRRYFRKIGALAASSWMALTPVCSSSASAVTSEDEAVIGTFSIFDRESDFLIAAPHGEFDLHTADIVWDFCSVVRWDCIIAEGFRDEDVPINVNRPTEGVERREARFTKRAHLVYSRYIRKIRKLTPNPRLYVEIHGNAHPATRQAVEVATVGISRAQAEVLETLMLKYLKEARLEYLEPRVDVLEKIRYRATDARKFGVLSFVKPAFHFEFPHKPRSVQRDRVVHFLSLLLPEIARREFGGK